MAKVRAAVMVLNRNLPEETDALCAQLEKDGAGVADVFVIESGSSPDRRSRYCRWWADWPEATAKGLRYARGFNFGLSQLEGEGRLRDYDYVFLVCNDVSLMGPTIPILIEEMDRHRRLGILSPCSDTWGERQIMPENSTAYVWHIYHIAWMFRRSFIEAMKSDEPPPYMHYLYDGSNFGGYYSDIELIAKGYIGDWATGLTNRVLIHERSELLKEKASQIVTEPLSENLANIVAEGKQWIRRKYGFVSRWQMQQFVQLYYEEFFRLNPELKQYRLL